MYKFALLCPVDYEPDVFIWKNTHTEEQEILTFNSIEEAIAFRDNPDRTTLSNSDSDPKEWTIVVYEPKHKEQ